MTAILDTISSVLIGGLILLSLHSLNTNLTNAASTKSTTTSVQENMSAVTDILENDLRKVGYNNFSSSNFIQAESSRVYLRADFNNDGSTDSVQYYLGTTADPGQVNPRARILYRTYNAGTAVPMKVGITRFRFWYYDGAGTPLATSPGVSNTAAIRSIKMAVSMDVGTIIEPKRLPNGTVKYDTTFSKVSWEKIMKPVNLK
jgi:hypothetical protein